MAAGVGILSMHKNTQAFTLVLRSIPGKRPVASVAGAVANTEIRVPTSNPVIDCQQSLLGVVVVDLHGTIAVDRRNVLIAKIVLRAGSIRHFCTVDRSVIVGPELDVPAMESGTRRFTKSE